MEAIHPSQLSGHLTKLYSDTKKRAVNTAPKVAPGATAALTALQRKYRIQKDRYITWGLEWNDETKGADGDIDESVAKAGLTETVASVMANIDEVINEAERIQSASFSSTYPKGTEKIWAPVDEGRYHDLVKDFTASVDTLYDLTRSRRALIRGDHPTFNGAQESPTPKEPVSRPTSIRKGLVRSPSFASSELTLVNPASFSRPALSPYAGLPPRIEPHAFQLPEEGPPPYESLGVPSTTRFLALLTRSKISETVQNAMGSTKAEVPVLVEWASFDGTYRSTGVPPPLQRLEALAAVMQPMRMESQTNISLLGYFEDTNQPRIGLVYDLPYSMQNRMSITHDQDPQSYAPNSLLKLLQKSSKTLASSPNANSAPALEDRFRIALHLVEQLQSLHADDFAHGNINSSSVLFGPNAGTGTVVGAKELRSPLWASFDIFSKCSVEGLGRSFNLNIYQHPNETDDSTSNELSARISYDLYGLSLILLEIGLWIPLGDLFKAKYTLADFKLRLEKIYIPKLAAKCGTSYMRAVQRCMRMADNRDPTTWPLASIYNQIRSPLQTCCLLDEDETVDDFRSSAQLDRVLAESRSADRVRKQRHPSPERFGSLDEVVMSSDTDSTIPSKKLWAVTVVQRLWRKRCIRKSQRDIQSSTADTPAKTLDSVLIQEEMKTRASDPRKARMRTFKVDVPEQIEDEIFDNVMPHLASLIERALKGSAESSSIDLVGYGETAETARPTILIHCSSTAKVKAVISRKFEYDRNLVDIRVRKGRIRLSRRSNRTRRTQGPNRSMAPGHASEDEMLAANPYYQQRPLCGASIGAYRERHLPPVSFGGIVMVDDVPYGMSVHHMVEAPSDSEADSETSSTSDDSDVGSLSDMSETDESIASDDGSQTDASGLMTPHGPTSTPEPGDTPGISSDDDIEVTQPSLDDAVETDLHADDASDSELDDDHIRSYKLGRVHASSGIRRTRFSRDSVVTADSGRTETLEKDRMPQEVDWALIELQPPRMQRFNVIQGGKRYCKKTADFCPNLDDPVCLSDRWHD